MSDQTKLIDAYIVAHRGDGRHASVVYTLEDAAREAIAGMWTGSLEEALEQEDMCAIYEAIRNPESDEWADYDGEEITFSFEDGSLSVLAIPVKVAAVNSLEGLLDRVERLEAALNDIATDKREHADDEVAIIYRMQDRAKAALEGT